MIVNCPACNKPVKNSDINRHLDSGCENFVNDGASIEEDAPDNSDAGRGSSTQHVHTHTNGIPSQTQTSSQAPKRSASGFFSLQTPVAKRHATASAVKSSSDNPSTSVPLRVPNDSTSVTRVAGQKRSYTERNSPTSSDPTSSAPDGSVPPTTTSDTSAPLVKKFKSLQTAPLAERMRPETLDDIEGQSLVSSTGILRSLIESTAEATAADRPLPSMILWGGSGTGKTTIARCVARRASARFVELNATAVGVAECKRIFAEAAAELSLTGRRTIIFCDEIHRFSKAQQDVFLRPVEAGTVTLIGATTENPSFKVQSALLSRCRTFALQKLADEDLIKIMNRALETEQQRRLSQGQVKQESNDADPVQESRIASLLDAEMLVYLAAFADGDARTALNLLEIALSLVTRPGDPPTKQEVKKSLTQTLVYDRAGDGHYDAISALHKSIRGSDPDAALFYLARMLESGEDALFVARRMVVMASEDIGLADSSMLSLATAAHAAVQAVGMPEARIPLAHCAVALALAPKSTRAYRGLNNALSALREPGVAGLPVPMHLRNAPTRLMKDVGCGRGYKYNPNYKDGRVRQLYLPDALAGRRFLEDRDLGTEIDPDLSMGA